jgi:hypothetical protein
MRKRLQGPAAEHQRRSLVTMLDVLAKDFCMHHGTNKKTAASPDGKALQRTLK